jgi:hypothetical protein
VSTSRGATLAGGTTGAWRPEGFANAAPLAGMFVSAKLGPVAVRDVSNGADPGARGGVAGDEVAAGSETESFPAGRSGSGFAANGEGPRSKANGSLLSIAGFADRLVNLRRFALRCW